MKKIEMNLKKAGDNENSQTRYSLLLLTDLQHVNIG